MSLRLTAAVGLVCLALPTAAQPTQGQLAAWEHAYAEALAAMEGVRFTEVTTRTVEGPYRTHRLRTVSAVVQRGGTTDRRLHAADAEGEALAPEEARARLERACRAFGRDADVTERLPLVSLDRLRPWRLLHAPVAEPLDGEPAWRLDLVPPRPDGPVEAATLWTTGAGAALTVRRSQVRLRNPATGALHSLTTDYQTVAGPHGRLPAPSRRIVETTLLHQRRWRTYVVSIHAETTYHDLRVDWRAPVARN